MQQNYQIEELTYQTSATVTYRARTKNGIPHTLTRLNLPPEELAPLGDGKFGQAYARLLNLQHGCLRPVTEGGLDPVDNIPWIATRWWEGKLLSDQIEKKSLTGSDIARIQHHGESLIQAMEEVSGALSFNPETIVTTRSLEGEKVTTFEFNYLSWFIDSAKDFTPGAQQNAYANLSKLIDSLEDELAKAEASAPTNTSLDQPQENTLTPGNSIAISPSQTTQGDTPSTQVPGSQLTLVSDEKSPRAFNIQPSDISDESSVPKKIAGIAAALIAIGISAYMLANRGPSTPNSAESGDKPPSEKVSELNTNSHLAHNNPTTPSSTIPEKVIERENPLSPRVGEQKDHTGSDSSSKIANTDSNNIGKQANLRPQKIFTIEDEEQLRSMGEETITLRAMVSDYTETATRSTLYLVFHEEGPGFRAGISPKKLGSDIDEPWLRQFVGKEILITGRVTTFENAKNNRGKRLVIRFSKKSSIELANSFN